MFRLFAIFSAFVAGGWLALRSSAIAHFVDRAVIDFFQLVHFIKEGML